MFEDIIHALSQVYNIPLLVSWGGYWILALIIFAETGLLIGFFLPGESLLVSAGLFAAAGKLNLVLLLVFLIPAAILGDATGFAFGAYVGKPLYERKESFFFRKRHLLEAKRFYEKHGGKAIVLARFVPFIRTFAPIAAGVADMPYPRFAMFNVVGAALWVTTGVFLGYFVGRLIPDIDKYLLLIIAAVVLLSLVPVVHSYLDGRKKQP